MTSMNEIARLKKPMVDLFCLHNEPHGGTIRKHKCEATKIQNPHGRGG